ncbi:MAG TPA: protein translocase subunit SecD, partial [Terriglobales bacterium]
MIKNLTAKVILIIAVLIFFLFGIFGLPKTFTPSGLLAALEERIHLGLDLKGGTHLILQVQVNDAINADSDRAIERLKDDLKSKNIGYGEISKPDPQQHPELISVKGIPSESIGEFRNLVADRLPDYDLASGPENSFTLTMKPSIVKDTKAKAQQQAIETIRNRIDLLGVNEPVIQEHGLGDYQILVQLPGVDDPARVKEIMQSTAMLEIRQAIGGPYSSEQEAMQANGGVLPANTVLL